MVGYESPRDVRWPPLQHRIGPIGDVHLMVDYCSTQRGRRSIEIAISGVDFSTTLSGLSGYCCVLITVLFEGWMWWVCSLAMKTVVSPNDIPYLVELA